MTGSPDACQRFQAIEPTWGVSFVDMLIKLYMPASVDNSGIIEEGLPRGGSQIAFEPQRVYSEIITDANVLCPSLYLAAQMQRNRSAPVSFYAVSQRMEHPFCALQEFNSFYPPCQFCFNSRMRAPVLLHGMTNRCRCAAQNRKL